MAVEQSKRLRVLLRQTKPPKTFWFEGEVEGEEEILSLGEEAFVDDLGLGVEFNWHLWTEVRIAADVKQEVNVLLDD